MKKLIFNPITFLFLLVAVFALFMAGLSQAQEPVIVHTSYQTDLMAADTIARPVSATNTEPSPFELMWGVISKYIDASVLLIVILVFGSMTVIKEVFGSYTKWVSHPDINIHTNVCVRYYYLKEWHIKLILLVVVIGLTILIRMAFLKPIWGATSVFEMLIAFICANIGYFLFAKKFIDWIYRKAKTSRDWITIEEYIALGGK